MAGPRLLGSSERREGMSEWIDFSPEPIEFAERSPMQQLGPLTPLLGVLGAMFALGLAVVLG